MAETREVEGVRVRYSELNQSLEAKVKAKIRALAREVGGDQSSVDDKKLATAIRDYFNKSEDFGGSESNAWHVIVGQHFVCSLKHETKSLIFVDLVEFHKSVLAFKSA